MFFVCLQSKDNANESHAHSSQVYNRTANTKTTKSNRKVTLGGRFRKELTSLIDTLTKTNPKFVRCMKSNMQKVGGKFDSDVMLKQLRYSGLLEVCRIRQCGYPNRLTYKEFYSNFWTLSPSASSGKELLDMLRNKGHFDSSQYQLGHTKVFFKADAIDALTKVRFTKLYQYATCIQACCKGFLVRCKWKKVWFANYLWFL